MFSFISLGLQHIEVVSGGSESYVLSVFPNTMNLIVERKSYNNTNQLWKVMVGQHSHTYNLVHSNSKARVFYNSLYHYVGTVIFVSPVLSSHF